MNVEKSIESRKSREIMVSLLFRLIDSCNKIASQEMFTQCNGIFYFLLRVYRASLSRTDTTILRILNIFQKRSHTSEGYSAGPTLESKMYLFGPCLGEVPSEWGK